MCVGGGEKRGERGLSRVRILSGEGKPILGGTFRLSFTRCGCGWTWMLKNLYLELNSKETDMTGKLAT